MPTIAVLGAGPGLGLSIARAFGANGFAVALVARSPANLDGLVEALRADGIDAEAFPADVGDHPALRAALEAAIAHFGTIEVLEFSPYGGSQGIRPPDLTVDDLRPDVEQQLFGAITATQVVLPPMLAAERGTLLFTTGGGAITPYASLATVNASQAALRNWALNLHGSLAERGVYVATVAINVMITDEPQTFPARSADSIAQEYWRLYTERRESSILIAD